MNRDSHVLKTVSTDDMHMVSGSGCRFKDSEGNEYLDFTGQANTASLGFNNREVLEAMRARLEDSITVSTYMLNEDQLVAADLLAEILPGTLNYSAFYSSGSAAVETAIKLAFRATGRRKIVSHWGGYHGYSGYALAASGSPFYRRSFEPTIPGFIHIPPPYLSPPSDADVLINNIKNAFAYEGEESIAAILVEPIVSNGVMIPPPGYLETMRELCDASGAILIFDEIVTGFGKTGKMFAFEHSNVEPDIVVMGKGITSSAIPSGAITVNERVMNMLGLPKGRLKGNYAELGQHIVTYQNHPLVCVAIKATIKYIIENNLVERSNILGKYTRERIRTIEEKYAPLNRTRGKGLMNLVETTEVDNPWKGDNNLAGLISEKLRDKGIYTFGANRKATKVVYVRDLAKVEFVPPLVVTKDEIDQAMDALEDTMKEVIG